MIITIDTQELLLGPKALYLLMCLPYYVFYTFRPLYFENVLNIKNAEYGSLTTFISLTGTVAPIFWTNMGDSFKRHRLMIQITAIGNCLFFLALIPLTKDTSYKFLIASVIVIGDLYFQGGMQPLLDATVMMMLKKKFGDEAKAMFGRQRVWGSIGYLITTNVVGALYNVNISLLFIMSGITTGIYLLSTFYLIDADEGKPKKGSNNEKATLAPPNNGVKVVHIQEKQPHETTTTWQKYKILFTNSNFMFFLLITFCNGFSRGVGSFYLSTFTFECIKKDASMISYQASAGTVFEIVLFFFNKRIVDSIGIYWMLILAQVAMSIRMAFYALIPLNQPNLIYGSLFVELFKGVSMACMTIPGVQIATSSAPKGLEATAIGMFISMFMGIAPTVSAFVGGIANEKIDRQAIFQISALLSWISMAGFFLKYYFVDKKISL